MCSTCAADEECGQQGCRYRAFAEELAAGTEHTCILSGTTLWCFGLNRQGQIGSGSDSTVSGPSRIGDDRWSALGLGSKHTCAVKRDGSLWCWGHDLEGALGNGSDGSTSRPVQTGTATDWEQVDGGRFFTCGIRSGGRLYCWGDNGAGELGVGSNDDLKTEPVHVDTESDGWATVALGADHACGVKSDGSLFCWGRNADGQLGTADGQDHNTPAPVGTSWSAVAAGGRHTCGIRAGSLFCWGAHEKGRLGLGQDVGSAVVEPRQVGDHTTWSAVAAGKAHTCAIRQGALYCWGANEYGQLGQGDAGEGTSRALPTRVGGPDRTWTAVGAGEGHTCAIAQSGRTFCWGKGGQGQLAHDGATEPKQAELPVEG
jgi:alpha-tubulin suppressor-like RCC1 family protein